MSRELSTCYGCRKAYGFDWLAPVELALPIGHRVVDLCLHCIQAELDRERIVDDTLATARATVELVLVALAAPLANATKAERALHRQLAMRMREPEERHALLMAMSQFAADEWDTDADEDAGFEAAG